MGALGFKFDNKQYQRQVELAPCKACISSFDVSIIFRSFDCDSLECGSFPLPPSHIIINFMV